MNCPNCGGENTNHVQVCNSCGLALSKISVDTKYLVPRTSALAILSFAFGIMSFFSFGLTVIPAIALGIISIIIIEKSGGKVTGRGFAVIGIVLAVLTFIFVFWPLVMKEKRIASRSICGANLANIGKAMFAYANDYDGQLPRSAGRNATWRGSIEAWAADNRFTAYGLSTDGNQGQASISSCFYLLVKYKDIEPMMFICPGDSGASVFKPADEGFGDRALSDLWDFGPMPSEHCSYSYHQPFSQFPLTTSSEPGMAIAADRNPWIESPAYHEKLYTYCNPYGDLETQKAGNAVTHGEDGQNVLFMDNHVGFERRAFCGINDDNIYTYSNGGDRRRGSPPISGHSEPQDRLDSLLVHDAP